MKVIGAGLPRTATLTQKVALEMLGLGPSYHMVNVLGDLELVGVWEEALDGSPDWDRIFGGCQSTVDWPGGFFYRELIEVYPDAKVVLSVRDPDSWERSMRATILEVLSGDSLVRNLSRAAAHVKPEWRRYNELMTEMWVRQGVLAADGTIRDDLVETFERHNEEVTRTVPADRLLTWSPVDGWEPLCEFLGAEVPAAPLPNVNDSATFIDRVVDLTFNLLDEWRHSRATEGATERPPAATPMG